MEDFEERPKKKAPDNWKLLNIFSEIWSEQYGGAQYPRSGRDFKATKIFLELYPYFFADEIEMMNARLWMKRFMLDNFWYQPNPSKGFPPMMHQFNYFVEHLSKYSDAKKEIKYVPKQEKKSADIMIHCTTCNSNHLASAPCKLQTQE